MLLHGLAARGEHYVVVATHVTNDLEAPALFLPSLACCYEVRFTDREVILARADHEPKLSNVQEGTFSANVSLLLPGGAVYTEPRSAAGSRLTSYGLLLSTGGFDDAWSAAHPHRPGLTCCQDEDLRNPVSAFDQRIDLILVRGRAEVEDAFLTSQRLQDRTASGLWPSDHAGVVGTLDFRH